MLYRNETPEQMADRGRKLLQRAIGLCGGPDADRAPLNVLMYEAKRQGLTWLEGLCYAVERLQQAGT